MHGCLSRRRFATMLAQGVAAGLAAASVPIRAESSRRLLVGHTGITWGFRPEDAEAAIRDVASLGYHGFESFGTVLEAWEEKGGLGRLLEAAGLPLHAAYCPVNLTDPTRRRDEVAKMVRWGNLIKRYGGSVSVIGPNNVDRGTYDFAAHRTHIVEALDEIGRALDDIGIVGVLHQHTDTCVETREETYAVMEAVDTRWVKFGPDVGQLQKGGADPVKVVGDFLSVVRHVHMKDYDGGEHYEGYCPLGQGEVDVAGLVDLLDRSDQELMIMAELDPTQGMPLAPLEAARLNQAYLGTLGYAFRTGEDGTPGSR